MPDLLLRDVPQHFVDALEHQAGLHGRSAGAEHRLLLEEALRAGFRERAAALREETRGRMCHKAIVAMGVGDGGLLGQTMSLVGKGGRVVWTNITPQSAMDAKINLLELTTSEKELVGSLYGSTNARTEFPKLFQLYRQGELDLDGMITRTYPLQEINQGYRDMREGRNIRGVIVYD